MESFSRMAATATLILVSAISLEASAGRATEVEIGYFSPEGYLNGSITYHCGGGRTIEGVLEGERRQIYSVSCNEPPGPTPTPTPWPCNPPSCVHTYP